MEMTDLLKNRIEKYKPLIEPKYITSEELIEIFCQRYTCVDITSSFRQSTWHKMSCLNLEYAGVNIEYDFHAFEIVKDNKSVHLYNDKDFEKDETVTFAIESNTRYIVTNNNTLLYEIVLEKSVTPEEYESNAFPLIDLVTEMARQEEE